MSTGYWFCSVCDRPTEVNTDREQNCCARCGSPLIRWVPPRLQNATQRHQAEASRLTQDRAEALFADLKASIQ